MSILQAYPQGVLLFGLSLLIFANCFFSLRNLTRTATTWRDGLLLSKLAAFLGLLAVALAVLDFGGGGLLAVFAYHRDQAAIRDVFAGLHSESASKARGEALLREVGGFGTVSRPTLAPAPPDVTEVNAAGTAADKALWLLARLDDPAARLAIGEAGAWVEATDAAGTEWIFDPAAREPTLKGSPSGSRHLARRVWSAADFANAVKNPK